MKSMSGIESASRSLQDRKRGNEAFHPGLPSVDLGYHNGPFRAEETSHSMVATRKPVYYRPG
jgi:hypothetical protein